MIEFKVSEFQKNLVSDSLPESGSRMLVDGAAFVMRDGIARSEQLLTASQGQTADAFSFQWNMQEVFLTPSYRKAMREWLLERYGDVPNAEWWTQYGERPTVLDAGCGASLSAVELFGDFLSNIDYIGVDVSTSVDVARSRFAESGYPGVFIQCDLGTVPIEPESVDVIFSEGVLHHTDSTENSLKRLANLLKSGGRFLFYVYRRKGPLREFTDDYIRDQLQSLSPAEAYEKLMPLTKLGKMLGDLNIEIEIEESIDLLEIPAGKINLQRLVYWHVAKMFYRPDFDLDEMNHYNYDWYFPKNASRHTEEELRHWCAEAGLEVEHEFIENPGVTMIARKR